MADAVIVSTARTPIGKAFRGAFNLTHGATMGGHVVAAAVERAGIEPGEVEDIIMGCGLPEAATGKNIARQCAVRAGLPMSAGGVTDGGGLTGFSVVKADNLEAALEMAKACPFLEIGTLQVAEMMEMKPAG